MSTKSNMAVVALMSSTALTMGAPAMAQDAEEGVLEEIIVTATRRATSVQDIPYNISAVSGDAIENSKMVDASELLRSIPGVAVSDIGMRNAGVVSTIKIRGLNVDGSGRSDYAVTASPTVASYINDTPLFAGLQIKDLERVEVLRGPQGTLYGAGALGGAVRYITHKPDLSGFSGYVQGGISKTKASGGENWAGDVVLNVPFSDTFGVRLVASLIDDAGSIDYRNLYVLDANGAPSAPNGVADPSGEYEVIEDADTGKSEFFRGTALFAPSEAFDATFTYTRQSTESGGRRASALGYSDGWGNPYGEHELGSIQRETAESDIEMGSLEFNVDLGFATLTSSTSHFKTSGNSISDNTGFYANAGWFAWYYNPGRPMAVPMRGYGTKATIHESRFVSNNDGPLNWIAGVYYQNHDNIATQQSFLPGSKAFGEATCACALPWVNDLEQDWDYDATTTSKELALFGEVTYDVSEDLHITGGLRWFDSKVTSDVHMALPYWPPGDIVDVNQVQDESDVLIKLNMSYDMNESTMVYGTFSQGYRRGGANAVPLVGWYGEDPAWFSYGSDTVDNFELGIKGSTDSLSYTVSAFYMDWTDPQLNTSSPNGGFFVVANSGGAENVNGVVPTKAKTAGVELEVNGRLNDNLSYTLGYAYVDAKLTSDLKNQIDVTVAPDGNKLPGVPQHMFNVALNYSIEINENTSFSARIDGYLQSESEADARTVNESTWYGETLPSFSIWNAHATVTFNEQIDVTLFVKNAFNNRGVTGTRTENWGGARPDLNYYGSAASHDIALPRTIGLSAKYNF